MMIVSTVLGIREYVTNVATTKKQVMLKERKNNFLFIVPVSRKEDDSTLQQSENEEEFGWFGWFGTEWYSAEQHFLLIWNEMDYKCVF